MRVSILQLFILFLIIVFMFGRSQQLLDFFNQVFRNFEHFISLLKNKQKKD